MEWGWKWKSPIVLLNMADYDESTMLMTRPIRCLQSSDAFPRSFLPAPPAHVYNNSIIVHVYEWVKNEERMGITVKATVRIAFKCHCILTVWLWQHLFMFDRSSGE